METDISAVISSTPTISNFDPRTIPFQINLIKSIRKKFDYTDGRVHEVLCSGSAGSSKSLVGAHLIITHCLENPNARVLIGRRSMPSLKDTILKKILDHMGEEVSYTLNKSRGIITFDNGSEIIPYSWGDNSYEKVRSLELSCALIEELTENDNMDFYKEIRMRVGRQPHIKESFILSLTNPGSPNSDFYRYFIHPGGPDRHVFYSLTTDNPYLPKGYTEGLKHSLDEKMVKRMLYGQWIEMGDGLTVYYSYDQKHNFKNTKYVPNVNLPIVISFDFNIAAGKPLSMVFGQFNPGTEDWHWFNEVIIEGQRTLDCMEEAASRGLLDTRFLYKVRGDATGSRRDTRSILSDYDIIENFMANYSINGRKLRFNMEVPRSNPPIRSRHNTVNGYIKNANGKTRLFVYQNAATVDEGLRLTKLKPGSQLNEDDSDRFQHCTTAVGYAICYEDEMRRASTSGGISSGRY